MQISSGSSLKLSLFLSLSIIRASHTSRVCKFERGKESERARKQEERRSRPLARGGKRRKNDAAAATFGAGAGFYQRVFADWWVKWHRHDMARISMFFGIFKQPG